MHKLIRITTVPISLAKLLKGQLRFMRNYFEVLGVTSDGNLRIEVERSENVTVVPIEMTRTISPIKDLIAVYRLYALFRRERPEIVHTHTPKAGFLGMIASKLAGVPIRLHTVAGLPLMEFTGLKRRVLNFVEKITYACASKVYPNSFKLRDFIIEEKFCVPNKLKVIGNGSSNGINTEEFKRNREIELYAEQIRHELGIKITDFTFIFIGRLVKDKGIEELVFAFTSLSKKYNDLKLLLVGPEERELDPLSASCLAEIDRNPSIIAIGFQSDVKPYLALSNALVFPSYREGFPNVPMQAGCFDVPAIVTNINGCNEIIIDGQNGLVIPVKNVEALMEAMEKMYLDGELRKEMSSKARQMIVERFEQKKVWRLILEEYNFHLKNNNSV